MVLILFASISFPSWVNVPSLLKYSLSSLVYSFFSRFDSDAIDIIEHENISSRRAKYFFLH